MRSWHIFHEVKTWLSDYSDYKIVGHVYEPYSGAEDMYFAFHTRLGEESPLGEFSAFGKAKEACDEHTRSLRLKRAYLPETP